MNYLTKGSDYLALHKNFRLVDRERELSRLTSVLLRHSASSVILAGPGGVGCTALCLGLQVAKGQPDAPFDLAGQRLFWLDVSGLLALDDPAQVSQAFARVIARVDGVGGGILAIEDGRGFLDGCRAAGVGHLVNALFAEVRAGRFKVILECLDDDLEAVLKSHSDARQLCTIIAIDEPSGDALTAIVTEGARARSEHHGIAVSADAVAAAVELTTRYRPRDAGLSRAQPERSLTLIDRALSAYRQEAHKRRANGQQAGTINALIAAIREAENLVASLEDRIEERRRPSPDNARSLAFAAMDSPEVAELRGQVTAVKADLAKKRDELAVLIKSANDGLELTRAIVLAEFADISGIAASKLNQDERDKLRDLESVLLRRVFGQDDAIKRIAGGVRVARTGRRGNAKPLPYLLMGPSGVGKTETAKALAAALLDDEAGLARFDMSEYMEKHAVAKLIGAPPGYEGFEAGGILTNLMRRTPGRVLLFDEIEKAHPDVFNVFLQILDEGRLTDNVGRTVSFAESIIVMTTNIGQTAFLDPALSWAEMEAEALAELDGGFRSEFLNRFAGRQNILCYRRLELASIQRVVEREVRAIERIYGESGLHLATSDEDLRAFCEAQYDPRIGARGLPGFIQATLEPKLADLVLAERMGMALVHYDQAQHNFTVEVKP